MNKKKLITLITVAIVAIVLGMLIPLKAANKSQGQDDIADFLEIVKIYKLTQELGLSSKQLVDFYPVYNKLQELKREYRSLRRETMKEYSLLAKNDASDRECEEAHRRYRAAEKIIVDKMESLRDQLEDQLTPKQKIKFMLFDDAYRRDVGKILQTVKQLNESKKKFIPLPVKENR